MRWLRKALKKQTVFLLSIRSVHDFKSMIPHVKSPPVEQRWNPGPNHPQVPAAVQKESLRSLCRAQSPESDNARAAALRASTSGARRETWRGRVAPTGPRPPNWDPGTGWGGRTIAGSCFFEMVQINQVQVCPVYSWMLWVPSQVALDSKQNRLVALCGCQGAIQTPKQNLEPPTGSPWGSASSPAELMYRADSIRPRQSLPV